MKLSSPTLNLCLQDVKSHKSEDKDKTVAKDSRSKDYSDEEFVFSDTMEQEYCELVDMTIEKDVVLYLRDESLYDLLQYILFATDFPRIQVR